MKTYTIAVDAYPLEYDDIVVTAEDEKQAYKKAWETLTSEERSNVASLDIVEVSE